MVGPSRCLPFKGRGNQRNQEWKQSQHAEPFSKKETKKLILMLGGGGIINRMCIRSY